MSFAVVGDAVQTRVEMTFEWKIRDFLSLSDKAGDVYFSTGFSFAGALWRLKLCPSGETEDSSAESEDSSEETEDSSEETEDSSADSEDSSVGLYLTRRDPGPPKTVHYTFGIKGSDGIENKKELKKKFSEKITGWGCAKFWSRSKLMDLKSTLLPDNVLTVTCDLKSDARCAVEGKNKVLKSLVSMLESGDDSDVVIKVLGKEFPAHRAILRARSSVFRSMFTHDMAEKQSNVVTIDDGDPDTFSDFLVHIYSGSCDQISEENVYSLYTAADKYDMGQLKEACARFMKSNITVACFCDVIAFALKHDDKELVECATRFFCDNAADIAKTVEWQTFLKENLTVGNELFVKAVSK